ncbi:MAG: STAS domain-containing protein [Eubacterium sp.]|nr:STAS domain-containing protein [Eubacterium sp.]
MEYKRIEGKLIISLPERVNESNAKAVKDEMTSHINGSATLDPVLDCTELKYISSSGLRSILSVQKKLENKKIILKNVNKEVYEILELTGFIDIFQVIRSVPEISIDGYEKIGACINGIYYRMQKGVMVKIYDKGVTEEEVSAELNLAKKALTIGVPTAISYSMVKCEGKYGIILEEVKALTLAQRISMHPNELIFLARKYANMVKELHETKAPANSFPSIKERYLKWLAEYENYIAPEKWAGLKTMVVNMADSDTFVHGDLNLNNVFMVDDELMLMDMASCGYGHPVFDLQALYASLVAIELDHPGYCANTFGISARDGRLFWEVFIETYMGHGDAQSHKKMNQLLATHYMLKEQLIDGMKVANK